MPPATKKKQVNEIIKCGKDPVYFINKYVKIQHPTRGLVAFDTYDFQDDCSRAFVDHRFNIILKSRQLGMSTLTAAYAVWLAAFYKDKNILVIATKLAVAMNFIKKVKVALRSMPKWLMLAEITSNNKQSVEFSNGSVIKAVPTSDDAGRSEALSLLIVDEAAFVRNFDELWMGLYPTLSTGGRSIILSTPNGVGGQYHDLWLKAQSGENEFNAIKLPWDVHPERDDSWFEHESKNLTKKQVAQELLCDFAASGDTFLSEDIISRVGASVRTPLERWGPEMGVWVWKYALTEHKYVIGADIARGDAKDYSTFQVIDTVESEVVAEYRGKIPPDQFAVLLNEAGARYNNALLCPENNTYGYAVIMKLRELGYTNMYFKNQKDKFAALYGEDVPIGKIGFTTSGQSRGQILTRLEEVLRNGSLRVYSSRVYEELKTFIWKGNKAEAQRGKNDDLVMALAIAAWLYDASPQHNKQAVDLNNAMLAAFGVNRTQAPSQNNGTNNPYSVRNMNPFRAMPYDSPYVSGSVDGVDDLGWLL
jgi:hypothetical protein